MDTKYLEPFKNEINKLSLKHSLPTEDVEFIIDDFFKRLKKWITDPRMPKIKIRNLGSFKPNKIYIDRYLRRSFYYYRLGKVNKSVMLDRVRKVWGVRGRLNAEKRGEITFGKWKTKK